jgi:hypothetical protein
MILNNLYCLNISTIKRFIRINIDPVVLKNPAGILAPDHAPSDRQLSFFGIRGIMQTIYYKSAILDRFLKQ